MEIEVIRAKKKDAQKKIEDILNQLQEETMLEIKSLDLMSLSPGLANKSMIVTIHLEVK